MLQEKKVETKEKRKNKFKDCVIIMGSCVSVFLLGWLINCPLHLPVFNSYSKSKNKNAPNAKENDFPFPFSCGFPLWFSISSRQAPVCPFVCIICMFFYTLSSEYLTSTDFLLFVNLNHWGGSLFLALQECLLATLQGIFIFWDIQFSPPVNCIIS